MFLSQPISDGFNKPRPGSRMILSTIDFSKAIDSVWHPALFHTLISAGLPPCFAHWTQSVLSQGRSCVVFQNTKIVPFESVEMFRKDPFLALYFSLFIKDFPAFLPSFVSCSFYAVYLAIWSSSTRSPLRWRPHKELCLDCSAGRSTGVFLSIRANVRPISFQWILTKLTSNPIFFYSAPASVSILLQLFLRSPSTALFPFLSMYFR